jgi:hypothetical protein
VSKKAGRIEWSFYPGLNRLRKSALIEIRVASGVVQGLKPRSFKVHFRRGSLRYPQGGDQSQPTEPMPERDQCVSAVTQGRLWPKF